MSREGTHWAGSSLVSRYSMQSYSDLLDSHRFLSGGWGAQLFHPRYPTAGWGGGADLNRLALRCRAFATTAYQQGDGQVQGLSAGAACKAIFSLTTGLRMSAPTHPTVGDRLRGVLVTCDRATAGKPRLACVNVHHPPSKIPMGVLSWTCQSQRK